MHEDPIALYIIVRTSLNMSVGKTAAQCSHASNKILMHYFTAQVLKAKVHNDDKFPKIELDHIKMTTEWLANHSRIVVLAANESEWEAVKNEFGRQCEIVKDNGVNELSPGTETAIALWPQHKSIVSKTIKGLSSLK